MDDNLKHIDQFYKDSLENFEADSHKKFAWGKLGLKLIILNIGGWSLFAASMIIIGIGTTVVFNIDELKEFVKSSPAIENLNKVSSIEPVKLKTFDYKQNAIIENRDEYLKEQEIYKKNAINNKPGNETKQFEVIANDLISKPESSESTPMESTPEMVSNTANVQSHTFFLSRIIPKKAEFNQNPNFIKISTQTDFSDSLGNLGIKTRKASLELFINPTFVFGKTSSSELSEDYISNRNNNESPIFTLGFGGDVKFNFNKLFLQTGLNFSQYGEKASYELNKQVYDPYGLVESIDTTFRWFYDPPYVGEAFIVSIDTNWIPGEKTVYYDQQTTNRISYIEIPVLGGYEWNMDKLSIDVSTGVSVGFAILKKGGLPETSNSEFIQLANISIAEPVFNYIFQAGVAIPLKERVKLLVKPNLKYTLNSIYNDADYPVNKHYLTIGIKAGVIIDL